MTKACAQMNSSRGTENGARFTARAFALILILVDIALAVSIIISVGSIIGGILLLAVMLLGALVVLVPLRCQWAVG